MRLGLRQASLTVYRPYDAATSPHNDDRHPSNAQIEAGNYSLGTIGWNGLLIRVENPAGSVRAGVDPNGKVWLSKLRGVHYGYVRDCDGQPVSTAKDGDKPDVFVGPHLDSDRVFVIDQVNADGSYDEAKCVIGARDEDEARALYLAQYSAGWKVGPVTELTVEEFKRWLLSREVRKPLRGEVFKAKGSIKNSGRNYLSSDSLGRSHWKRLPRNIDALRAALLYEVARGGEAMGRVIATHEDVADAMYRPGLGAISFEWGLPGRLNGSGTRYVQGHGVSKIIAQRNLEGDDGVAVARILPRVIGLGRVIDIQGEGTVGERVLISDGKFTAVLSLYRLNERKTWLLTGWRREGDAAGVNPNRAYTRRDPNISPGVGASSPRIVRLNAHLVKLPRRRIAWRHTRSTIFKSLFSNPDPLTKQAESIQGPTKNISPSMPIGKQGCRNDRRRAVMFGAKAFDSQKRSVAVVCPHCRSTNTALLPPDFETCKCGDCGRNFQHPDPPLPVAKAAGDIRSTGRNYLGVDRSGRIHWRSKETRLDDRQQGLFSSAAPTPPVTKERRELVREHERLVEVLRSPSHADDLQEAERQAAELHDLKGETPVSPPDEPTVPALMPAAVPVLMPVPPFRLMRTQSRGLYVFPDGNTWEFGGFAYAPNSRTFLGNIFFRQESGKTIARVLNVSGGWVSAQSADLGLDWFTSAGTEPGGAGNGRIRIYTVAPPAVEPARTDDVPEHVFVAKARSGFLGWLVAKAQQLGLFGGVRPMPAAGGAAGDGDGSIKHNPTNTLGVDKRGRIHWRTTKRAELGIRLAPKQADLFSQPATSKETAAPKPEPKREPRTEPRPEPKPEPTSEPQKQAGQLTMPGRPSEPTAVAVSVVKEKPHDFDILTAWDRIGRDSQDRVLLGFGASREEWNRLSPPQRADLLTVAISGNPESRERATQMFRELRPKPEPKPETKPEPTPAEPAKPASGTRSEAYRYRDVGYVAGSRKEIAQAVVKLAAKEGREVQWQDVDWSAIEENERAAAALIKKANVFGTVDWGALREAGMTPGAGFLVRAVYAAIGTEPDVSELRRRQATSGEDSGRISSLKWSVKHGRPEVPADAMAREDYVRGINTIRQRMEACRTPQDVIKALQGIQDERTGEMIPAVDADRYAAIVEKIGVLHQRSVEIEKRARPLREQLAQASANLSRAEYRSRGRAKVDPKQLASLRAEKERAQAALEAVTGSFEQERDRDNARHVLARERADILKKARAQNLMQDATTRAWHTFGDKFAALLGYMSSEGSHAFFKNVQMVLTGKVKDWSWAESETKPSDGREKPKPRFELLVADTYNRVGGREAKVASSVDLQKTFNLRAVQSGNWVLDDQASGKFHMEQCAAAFADLADVVGISDHDISLKGRLAMAFGARGQGGAKAHYEPVERVINMTKMAGAGSLAHEWFHALDNLMLAAYGVSSAGAMATHLDGHNSNLPKPIADAFADLTRAMTEGNIKATAEHLVTPKDDKLASLNMDRHDLSYGSGWRQRIAQAESLEKAIEAIDDMHANGRFGRAGRGKKQYETVKRIALAWWTRDQAGKERTVKVASGPGLSQYLHDARDLQSGKVNGYWSSTHEMAARAFAAYTSDRLRAQGRKNDYLTFKADSRFYIDGRPYPAGEERTRINAAFDKLFEALRAENAFYKAALAFDRRPVASLPALRREREQVLKAMFYLDDEDLPVAHASIRPVLIKRQLALRARHEELSRQIAALGMRGGKSEAA